MGKKSSFRFSVRYRYLLSFWIVALIPISFILIFFYRYNVEELRKDVQSLNLSRVAQIKNDFDAEILSYFRLSQSLYTNQQFLYLIRRGTQSDVFAALTHYQDFLQFRGLSDNVFVMVDNRDQVYTRSGISSYKAFFANLLKVDEIEAQAIQKAAGDIPAASAFSVLSAHEKDGKPMLLCMYRMPSYALSPTAIMLVKLDMETVTDKFSLLLKETRGTAFLLNAEDELLFQSGLDNSLKEVLQGVSWKDENIHPLTIEGKLCTVIYTHSRTSRLTYGVIDPENAYLTKVSRQITLFWNIILFVIVVSIAAVTLLATVSYRPIKALTDLTGTRNADAVNEYERIRRTMLDSADRTRWLETVVEVQRPYVLERLLSYVLFSEGGKEQIHKLLEAMEIHFDYEQFFVICVSILTSDISILSAFKLAVIETVESKNSPGCHAFTLERTDAETVIIVVNCNDQVDRRAYATGLQQSIAQCTEKRWEFSMGVGSRSGELEYLKNSLYEATVLLSQRVAQSPSFTEEIMPLLGGTESLYPVRDTMLLMQQLRQGDEESCLKSLQKLCLFVGSQVKSEIASQYILSYIVNAITEVVGQIGKEAFMPQIYKMMNCHSIEEFQTSAGNLLHDFCLFVNEKKKSSNTRLRDEINAYIHEQIANPGLGLDSIAEAFGLSPYYVSRFFRDQNNINLKDYMADLRMQKAKELLSSTMDNVTSIVETVGYISTSSFSRKFKAATGMTPGEYREAHGHGP